MLTPSRPGLRSLLPALAYTLDMYRRTGGFYGANEALFSSALAAMVFSLLGAQPLTIVGITGLISLFNYTIYDIVARYGKYGTVFRTLLETAAEELGEPGFSKDSLELSAYDVVTEQKYPNLEDVDAVLISGSSESSS